jgi:hypothetical protein
MTDSQKRDVRLVNGINIGILLVLVSLCFIKDGGIITFFGSLFFGGCNFISMIVFIAKSRPEIFLSNIIWMLLMPIIGFGCCAATVNFYH